MEQQDFSDLIKTVLDAIDDSKEMTLEEAVKSGVISPELGLLIVEALLIEQDDENYGFGRSREERRTRSIAMRGGSEQQPKKSLPQNLIARMKELQRRAREYAKQSGYTGAAAAANTKKMVNKPLERYGSYMLAKHDDGFVGGAEKDYIKKYLNKKGMLEKLKKAGLSTKVKVSLDRETGNWHVTDSSGQKHVIEQLIKNVIELTEDIIQNSK